jgi:hypothetical protein
LLAGKPEIWLHDVYTYETENKIGAEITDEARQHISFRNLFHNTTDIGEYFTKFNPYKAPHITITPILFQRNFQL